MAEKKVLTNFHSAYQQDSNTKIMILKYILLENALDFDFIIIELQTMKLNTIEILLLIILSGNVFYGILL